MAASDDSNSIPPEWLAEFEAAARRPLPLRMKYAFIKTYKPVMDDAKFRAFDTTAQYRQWCELRIAALNRALEGIPLEKSRYHICWGSWNGPHMFDVPLKDILDIVLKVNVGAYSFEAANPRHEHEWQVWKSIKLAPGRALMPGVVTHSTNIVEHPELVSERLQRFASCIGPEHVIAGTDCGFSQSPLGARVHRTIMWAKLKALAEGARLASHVLWGHRSAA